MRTCKKCKKKFEPKKNLQGNLPKFIGNNRFCSGKCRAAYGRTANYWYTKKVYDEVYRGN